MDFAIRSEKMRFLIAEMQLAFQLTKHAPDSFMARTLALHIIIRAKDFIEHARAVRKPLGLSKTSDFHTAKEAYADTFVEYYGLARDKIGAHFQDLDFGKRIELWTAIDQSKIEYFVDGAAEVYGKLAGVPGYEPYTPPVILNDAALKAAFADFSRRRGDTNWVEMSSDPLAATRENTTAVMNGSTLHARAGQVTLIKRWGTMLAPMLAKFTRCPEIVRIVRANIITDFVSYCDCLVTRPVTPGAPQEMDGLDTILTAQGFSAAPITEFVTSSRFDEKLAAARVIRNKIGAHLEEDDGLPLATLLTSLDDFDLDDMLKLMDLLHQSFIATCYQSPILRIHAADGRRVHGVTASKLPSNPYSDQITEAAATPLRAYIDDEASDKTYLTQWLDGDEHQKEDARQLFWNGFLHSEIVETIAEKERFGESWNHHAHQYRRLHKFIETFLVTCNEQDFGGVMQLLTACRSGDPYALGEVLVRTRSNLSPNKDVWLCYALGEIAWLPHASAIAFLEFRATNPFWPVRLQSLVSRYKIFARSKGKFRINKKDQSSLVVGDLIAKLVTGLAPEERFIAHMAMASQLANAMGSFAQPFTDETLALRTVVENEALAFLDPTPATAGDATLTNLLGARDYVGAAVHVAIKLESNEQRKNFRRGLLEAVGNGTIVTAEYIASARNLAVCFLLLEQYEIALEQAWAVANRAPGDLKYQNTILMVLANTPGAAQTGLDEITRLRATYKLDAGTEENLAEVERDLIAKRDGVVP